MAFRKSRVDETGAALKGSQRQIQLYVNQQPDVLREQIVFQVPTFPQAAAIAWVSPLTGSRYGEYNDEEFLHRVGLHRWAAELRNFWPKGGPHWDALAITACNGKAGVILVEAKAHPTEIYDAAGCRASQESRGQIEDALRKTREWLGLTENPNWTGALYQAANRLAHLYFLREVAHVDAWLLNLYFADDHSYQPTSRDEWDKALAKVKSDLGLGDVAVPFVREIFLQAI